MIRVANALQHEVVMYQTASLPHPESEDEVEVRNTDAPNLGAAQRSGALVDDDVYEDEPGTGQGRKHEADHSAEERFLPAPQVWRRYGVTSMSLHRWLRDPEMNFPQPLYFGRFRHWRLSDLVAWERQACGRQGR